MPRGKKYQAAKKLVEKGSYAIPEAVTVLKKTSTTSFDATCEVHLKLGLDPEKAEQNIRGTVVLPHGTGKTLRVIAIVPEAMQKKAKDAGASEVGAEELVQKIAEGWLDFDVAVAMPEMMAKLGKVAKTLGQKGLMPNPKAGTVTTDPAKTISEILKGKVEYRLDKTANIHNIFGKVSFDEPKLEENLRTFLQTIRAARPASAKGTYIQSITIATTMGPGVSVSLSEVA